MSINTSLSEQLIQIVQIFKESDKKLTRTVREKIRTVQNGNYFDTKIQQKDILIIASIWYGMATAKCVKYDPVDLLNQILNDPIKALKDLDRIIKLIKIGILDSRLKRISANVKNKAIRISIDKELLFETDVFISKRFLRKLVTNQEIQSEETKPYRTNKKFINDWFAYVDAVRDLSVSRFIVNYSQDDESISDELYSVAQKWQRIEENLSKTQKRLPLMEISDEYHLDHNEQIIIMYLLKQEIDNADSELSELIEIISKDRYDLHKNRTYLLPNANLITNGIVETKNTLGFRSKTDVRLCSDIARRLLNEAPVGEENKLEEILRGNPIISCLHPKQQIEDIILDENLKQTLLKGLGQYRNNVSKTLDEWGLLETSSVKNSHGLLILLYGSPGTGKTFCAGATANYLKKPLLTTDISKILSAWVGESEKNVRNLFLTYDRIIKRTHNAPILLLNEADQFLSKRGETTRSTDRMYNQMQNLFLEAFEEFPGILICTTNLRDNFDPAFSRRFHLKLRFPLPKINERIKLWQLHLPKSIPGVNEIDINHLASRYELSGGQISVVIKNAATEAAGRKGHNKILEQDDLIKYCQLEINTTFDNCSKKYGFNI